VYDLCFQCTVNKFFICRQRPLMSYDDVYVRKIMTEERYSLLWKCPHFIDNTTLPAVSNPAEKSFEKIKWFFDKLIERVLSIYLPEENIAIGESLMLWKGRLAMKQYIPSKRARIGLKSYELCELSSDYIWNAIVHTETAMQLENSPDNLASSRIGLTLAKDLLGKGYSTVFSQTNGIRPQACLENSECNKHMLLGLCV
jgi:hypothetical protein